MTNLAAFWKDEQGQDMVEYSLLLVLIAAVAILVLTSLGTSVVSVYDKLTSALSRATANIPE